MQEMGTLGNSGDTILVSSQDLSLRAVPGVRRFSCSCSGDITATILMRAAVVVYNNAGAGEIGIVSLEYPTDDCSMSHFLLSCCLWLIHPRLLDDVAETGNNQA